MSVPLSPVRSRRIAAAVVIGAAVSIFAASHHEAARTGVLAYCDGIIDTYAQDCVATPIPDTSDQLTLCSTPGDCLKPPSMQDPTVPDPTGVENPFAGSDAGSGPGGGGGGHGGR